MSNKHEIQSEKIYIQDVFNKWFRIPEYQRPYVWGKDQINDLLDDLSYAATHNSESDYFLGSFVFQHKPANKSEKRDSEVGNFMELANMAQVSLGKAEPYTLLPLSFLNEEIFAEVDQTLLMKAISQGYDATLKYKENNAKLMSNFKMLYMNEADFNSLMSGKTTDLSKLKSLGDMSQGYAVFVHINKKTFSILGGFKFK